jgi:predicted ester cyclase
MAAGKHSLFRIADGKIVEHWGVFDQLAMMAQLAG